MCRNYEDVQAGVSAGYSGQHMLDLQAYWLGLIGGPRNQLVGMTAYTIMQVRYVWHSCENFHVKTCPPLQFGLILFSQDCILILPQGFDEGTGYKKRHIKYIVSRNMSPRWTGPRHPYLSPEKRRKDKSGEFLVSSVRV